MSKIEAAFSDAEAAITVGSSHSQASVLLIFVKLQQAVINEEQAYLQAMVRQSRVAEAARAFAAVTPGLEHTKEGLVLLIALKQLEAMDDSR